MFGDAEKMLDEIIKNGELEARGVVGFYPANSRSDDVLLWDPAEGNGKNPIGVLHGLRQQVIRYHPTLAF